MARLRTITTLLLVMVFGVAGLYAEEAPSFELPKDDRPRYNAAICEFNGISLRPENAYLTSSVPRLILEKLADIPVHRLTGEEMAGHRKAVMENALVKAGQELATRLSRRDELLFSGTTEEKFSADYRTATVQVNAEREYLDFLRSTDPAMIPVADEKPLSLAAQSNGILLRAPSVLDDMHILALAREKNDDMLVVGTIEEIQGYLYFQIEVWSTLSSGRIGVFQDAVTPDSVSPLVDSLSDELAGAVLGRPWGTVRVAAVSTDAFVYIDGNLTGTGETTVRYLSPGAHTVRVEREGFRPDEQGVEVVPGTVTEVAVNLEEIPKETTSVLTDPPGADVYVGSVWKGKTPVSIETPSSITRILIRLPGYMDVQHIITPADSRTLNVKLVPDTALVPSFSKSRDDFYTSLGMFVLSLPFTVGLYGMYQNLAIAYNNNPYSTQSEVLADSAKLFYVSYIGGLAGSGALFVNMIFRLLDYIRTGEATF